MHSASTILLYLSTVNQRSMRLHNDGRKAFIINH